MINKIGKITIYVNDQEDAKLFWTKKLSFVVTYEKEMGPNMKWVEVAPSKNEFTSFVLYDKNLMISQNEGLDISHPSIILSTRDINGTYEQMVNNNIEVGELMEMPYGRMFSFKDQDGNDYLVREDK